LSYYAYNPTTGWWDDPIYQYFPVEKYPLIISKNTSSALEPSYTWNGDTGTGMYRPADYEVALTTNSVERFKVTNLMTTISNATTLSSTLNVTGVSTLSSLTVNSVFKLTSGSPGPGKTLMSDSAGNGTWQDTLVGVPYGTIIMWVNAECVPTGWKVCLIDTYSYIFIKDRYHPIPDMRDYSISGNSTMVGGYQRFGTKSPKTQYSFSIDKTNLPPHTHGSGTLKINSSGGHTHTVVVYEYESSGSDAKDKSEWHDIALRPDSTDNISTKESISTDRVGKNAAGTATYNSTAGNHTHAATEFAGETGNGPGNSTAITLPLNKSIGMIFIIKYNPGGAEHTEGFTTYELIAKNYNEANGKTFTTYGAADNAGLPPVPGDGPIGA
jgi:hypothetical protein